VLSELIWIMVKTPEMEGDGFKIISNSDGIYEGNIRKYKRHGYGMQKWHSGEMFKGMWKNDVHVKGTFQDSKGRLWKGNFVDHNVRLVYEPSKAISPKKRNYSEREIGIPVDSPYKPAEARANLNLLHIEDRLAKLTKKLAEKKAEPRLDIKNLLVPETPGPTSYSPHIVGVSSPKFTMSKRIWAPNDIEERDDSVPGPTDYDPDDSCLLKNVPSALNMDKSGIAAGYSFDDPRSPKKQAQMAKDIERRRDNLKIDEFKRAEISNRLTSPQNRNLNKCNLAGYRNLGR